MFLRQSPLQSHSLFAFVLVVFIAFAAVIAAKAKPPASSFSSATAKLASCLPANVQTSDVAVYKSPRNITVGDKLKTLKAQCKKGRLIGGDRREIRIVRPECFGFPPPDYQEIQERQRRELQRLKAKYSVIVIECDPRIG